MRSDNIKKCTVVLTVLILAYASASYAQKRPASPAAPVDVPLEMTDVQDSPPPSTYEGGEPAVAPPIEPIPTANVPVTPPPVGDLGGDEKVYLNVQDSDIKDVIKQISKATGRNFIIDDKVRGKVTIISERPMTREEAYQTFLSALEVAGFTTVKGPANVIKVVSLKDAAKSPIPTHVDSTPYTDSFITRLIALENISALEMSNAIKDLVSKDGNLFAYPATNTLIITDSGSNIDRIMKIVKELDQEGPQQVMEIIPIKNALATDIAQMVQDLFDKEKSAAGGAAAAKRTTKRAGAGTSEELDEVSKIIADERTNSIIVLASKRAIENVRSIIQKLDSRLTGEEEGRIHVYYLKHAKAKEMAETLSSLTAAAGAAAAKGGKAGGGTDIAVAKFDGGIKITADETTNALIVTALPKDFKTLIDRVISKLDIPRRQVYFEAVVMEMTLNKGLEYGVQGYGGAGVGGSMIGMGQTLGGPALFGSIIQQSASKGTAAWPGILGGLVSSKTTNITYVGADGTSQTLTMPAFSAFLSALSTRGEANIISTPNILTLDNEEAEMKILQKEPTPGSTTFTSAATTATSVDYKEAGLELKIKPQITEGDMVQMEITQKLSGFATAQYSSNLNAPALRERTVKTTVVTENGQTVVLAGLMEENARTEKRKIPLLGDIPLLGILFSTTTTSSSKGNLIVFITPHVIKDRTDFTNIMRRKIEERNSFLESNFSKSRQKQIRGAIQSHRKDLLEFSEPIAVEPSAAAGEGEPTSAAPAVKKVSAPQPTVYTPPAYIPPAETYRSKPPVITVPGSSSDYYTPPPPAQKNSGKGVTSRGAAVPPPAPEEMPSWKSVEPPKTYPKPAYEEKAIEPEPRAPVAAKPSYVPPVESQEEKPSVYIERKVVPPPPKAEKKIKEPEASKVPSWIPATPEGAPAKTYNKPVIPTPAFEDGEKEGVTSRGPVVTPPAVEEEKPRVYIERKVVPTAPLTPEEELKKKKKKKPVISETTPQTVTPPPQEEVKKAEKTAPVITAPPAVKEDQRTYNKPAPAVRNGTTDLAY